MEGGGEKGEEKRERKKERGRDRAKEGREGEKEGGRGKRRRQSYFLLPMKSVSLRPSCLDWPLRQTFEFHRVTESHWNFQHK